MKKKIIITIIITIVFSLVLATTSFLTIFNVENMRKVKSNLKNYAEYIVRNNYEDINEVKGIKLDNTTIRCTYINSDGQVIYDTLGEVDENHLNRIEVKEALKYGEAYAVRNSTTDNEKLVYYAKKLDNGNILRLSVSFKSISYFNFYKLGYSLIIGILIFVFTFIISMKLVRTIMKPVNELEEVTSRIARGDLHIRAKAKTNDELGTLGKTFNNMADQLQSKMNEVMDKQNRLESIVKSMESGVIAVDLSGNIIIINPYAKRIFGIKDDITGEKIYDYIKDFDINYFLNEEEEIAKEIKILHPAERELKIKKAFILSGREKIGKVIAVQDISDIKRLENMRSQFVANVTHELKTPLTSIKGFAETLKYVEDEKTREKFLDIIDNEAERLSRLISDILVLSKIESSTTTDDEDFMPYIVIDEVISIVKNMAESKNISLIVEKSEKDIKLHGDKDKFLQLVLNLVENGIKYSNEGSTVKVRSFIKKGDYILEVEDNGIGIPKEDMPRIFERFYRVDKSRKGGGTGLGLAIVKHIVKIFNGEISIESELNKGSIFTVTIKNI
ncbi:MAG: ATP-binding protein [Clostridium sp.]|jgi:two-component system phosphate regulon sensor histidine kinase PhoR|nr:HAMP domain-containing protein [Clostridium sp.]